MVPIHLYFKSSGVVWTKIEKHSRKNSLLSYSPDHPSSPDKLWLSYTFPSSSSSPQAMFTQTNSFLCAWWPFSCVPSHQLFWFCPLLSISDSDQPVSASKLYPPEGAVKSRVYRPHGLHRCHGSPAWWTGREPENSWVFLDTCWIIGRTQILRVPLQTTVAQSLEFLSFLRWNIQLLTSVSSPLLA